MSRLLLSSVLGLVVLTFILYSFTIVIYRLLFHPLRSFPGPLLASTTNLSKFYYNWYCEGLHSSKIKEWHKIYGPIVRIAPNELHFSDPHAYKTIYSHRGLLKEPDFYNFMTEDSLVGQIGSKNHKKNRRIFGGFFSTSAIRTHGEVGGILWNKANQIFTTLHQLCHEEHSTVNITDVSKCFTYDVIKELVSGSSNVLSDSSPDFKPPFVVANSQIKNNLWFVQQFPFLVGITRALPDFILSLLSESLLVLRRERANCCEEVIDRSRAFNWEKPKLVDICSQVICARQRNTKVQISDDNLGFEMFDFLIAGTEIPANAISFGLFHVTRTQHVIQKLQQELQPSNQLPSLAMLEKLPYLNAVVNETLRLGNLVPGRLPRVTPFEGMNIAGLHIPGGTVVSASTHLIHLNPSIFPEPEKFIPERWLSDVSKLDLNSDKYLLPFSTGSRDCIGSNLATAEIRMAIASIISYFDIEPANPQYCQLDLEWRDNIVASYNTDVRVHIRERCGRE